MAILKVKQTKSRIGAPKDQKRTLDSLGLRKMGRVIEIEDTPSNLGRIRKVRHLVTIID
ncbi:MAG: 50S ribosomal protein L30 [Alloprevotella sp.]|nr:50S ribosomal protein L30 [Alloprevotella sp.]MBR1732483.1 50S ribosomal protein L30 [Alloprevotella sp.]